MSEPVKQAEIEDVLSSIRRLVSEDNRKPAAREAAPAPQTPSRFVLTEALRIPDPDEAEAADTGEGEDSAALALPETSAEARADLTAGQDDPVEDDAAGEGEAAQLPDEHPDAQAAQSSDMPIEAEPPETQLDAESAARAATPPDAQSWADDLTAALADGAGQTQTVSPDRAGEGAPQPDDENPVEEGRPWADPEATLYDAAGLSEGADTEAAASDMSTADAAGADEDSAQTDLAQVNAAQEDSAEPEASTADTRPLGDKIAALEKVIAQTEDQWEPDDPGLDDYAGTDVETLEWEDASDEREEAGDPDPEGVSDAAFISRRAPEAPVEDRPAAPQADLDDTSEGMEEPDDVTAEEDALLDEDALRDLIADIVREELQGALGERITRNVRKLVRREIHRALAVQDLD